MFSIYQFTCTRTKFHRVLKLWKYLHVCVVYQKLVGAQAFNKDLLLLPVICRSSNTDVSLTPTRFVQIASADSQRSERGANCKFAIDAASVYLREGAFVTVLICMETAYSKQMGTEFEAHVWQLFTAGWCLGKGCRSGRIFHRKWPTFCKTRTKPFNCKPMKSFTCEQQLSSSSFS